LKDYLPSAILSFHPSWNLKKRELKDSS